MFEDCWSLTSLDLSNFNVENAYDINYMFYSCYELHYLDISSFIVYNNVYLLDNLPNNCTIKINYKSYNKIKNIPSECKIIYTYD